MILHDLIEGLLRGIEGKPGRFLRYHYYRQRLASCGRHVSIDPGVHLINPGRIRLGDHVWIDRNVIISGGPRVLSLENTVILDKANSNEVVRGEVFIGEYSHIGIGAIIQGHGGVYLDKYCTTSPGCKIYSYSNDVTKCMNGTIKAASYILHPVFIGSNTWLGINTTILGGHIGANCFIKPYTLVSTRIPDNSIYEGTDRPFRKRFVNIQ